MIATIKSLRMTTETQDKLLAAFLPIPITRQMLPIVKFLDEGWANAEIENDRLQYQLEQKQDEINSLRQPEFRP
jgi:hypothetical protein